MTSKACLPHAIQYWLIKALSKVICHRTLVKLKFIGQNSRRACTNFTSFDSQSKILLWNIKRSRDKRVPINSIIILITQSATSYRESSLDEKETGKKGKQGFHKIRGQMK
jgi:hypothetical protein